METLEQILSLIGQYRYLIIFFGVMLESVGVPIPGETVLIASGLLVQQGRLDLGDAVLFRTLGAMVGDQIDYWVAKGDDRSSCAGDVMS